MPAIVPSIRIIISAATQPGLSTLNLLAYSSSPVTGFPGYSLVIYSAKLRSAGANCTTTMRYDDWDVILFPKDSQTPIQEFRTACYHANDNSE
jgi:hypothetical protein